MPSKPLRLRRRYVELALKFAELRPTHRSHVISPGHQPDLQFPVKALRHGSVKELAFADLLTRRTIVSVYMKGRTPSCDRQNESLAAHAREFEQAGYEVIALSRDTVGAQGRYAADKGIHHTLVSDPDDRFARATDSLVPKSMYGRTFVGPQRAAYIFEGDGTLLAVIPKVDPGNHAAQVREAIQRL